MDDSHRQFAREVIETEADAVRLAGLRVIGTAGFDVAATLVLECKNSVLTCGIGKAGHIARKVAATFASTGTPSHYLSPADALHGDLGAVRTGDVVMIFSASGESDEILRVFNIVKQLGHPVIAITSSTDNNLGKHADAVLAMGKIEEACPLRLAPSASTTAMLAIGDALALTVMKMRNFTADDFALFHPAGQLGRKLMKVGEAMSFKIGENLPIASDKLTVGEVLQTVSKIKRRSGAVILVNESQRISGFFSDGDLRRLITRDNHSPRSVLQIPIAEVMTKNPKRIHVDALASEATALMHAHRFDELPVTDSEDRPVGVIDVQDLVVLRIFDAEGRKRN
jgi:arabinose-5-phosphate isomerase